MGVYAAEKPFGLKLGYVFKIITFTAIDLKTGKILYSIPLIPVSYKYIINFIFRSRTLILVARNQEEDD